MAFLIQNTRTDDFIADVSGDWPDWTPVRSFAKRFSTKQEAEQFIAKNQVKGDDPYMKVVKEMKGLKEFVKAKAIKEEGNIKMHRNIDDVDVIIEPDGSYTFWKGADKKTKGAQNRSLKGQEGAVKELQGIGYEIVKESAQVDDRFYGGGDYPRGEVNVYSDTGAYGLSVQMGRYSVGTDTSNINWHVGYCAQGPYNSGANKVKQVKADDDVEKIVKKDLDEFKTCLKRCIEYCDREIASTLKKLGYK